MNEVKEGESKHRGREPPTQPSPEMLVSKRRLRQLNLETQRRMQGDKWSGTGTVQRGGRTHRHWLHIEPFAETYDSKDFKAARDPFNLFGHNAKPPCDRLFLSVKTICASLWTHVDPKVDYAFQFAKTINKMHNEGTLNVWNWEEPGPNTCERILPLWG